MKKGKKLYEFTFLDKHDIGNEEMIRLIEQELSKEAELQNWAPGYTFFKKPKEIRQSDGSIQYFFEVYGDWTDNENE